MRVLVMVSLALTSVSVPAIAEDTAPQKRICKRADEQATGSNLRRGPTKVCRTAAEWKELEEGLERELNATAANAREERLRSGAGGDNGLGDGAPAQSPR